MGLILEPMTPAFIGIIAVTVSMLFKVGPAPVVDKATGVAKAITDAQAISWGLSGFSNAIVWLIFAAFMIGIGYAIAITDLVLAPFIPSNAARSGGTIYLIVSSICPMFESYPDKNPRKIGSYLNWGGIGNYMCV